MWRRVRYHRHMKVAFVLTLVIVGVFAQPGRPCSSRLPSLEDATFPFEDRTVPRNAVFHFGDAFPQGEELAFIRDDGGERIEASVPASFGGALIPERPLSPGAWRLVIMENPDLSDLPDQQRVVAFVVDNNDDITPPSPPTAFAVNELHGELFDFSTCDSALHDIVVVTAESDDAFPARIVIDDRSNIFRGNSATLNLFTEQGGVQRFDVAVEDIAGNQSAPTTVEVWTGCAGACASGDPSLPAALSMLLLARRRVRRAITVGLSRSSSTWRR